ncbi:Hypothetical_protein [Hexamita inflata]|uniref:Hypothetical_protein n=1 Tax=Hexamita inflata TaxID=28002 RepID=A0AA86UYH3_9EUKA|nr:Hypothetical protein HINF_LOCUS40473 [Hexamita inflata]
MNSDPWVIVWRSHPFRWSADLDARRELIYILQISTYFWIFAILMTIMTSMKYQSFLVYICLKTRQNQQYLIKTIYQQILMGSVSEQGWGSVFDLSLNLIYQVSLQLRFSVLCLDLWSQWIRMIKFGIQE